MKYSLLFLLLLFISLASAVTTTTSSGTLNTITGDNSILTLPKLTSSSTESLSSFSASRYNATYLYFNGNGTSQEAIGFNSYANVNCSLNQSLTIYVWANFSQNTNTQDILTKFATNGWILRNSGNTIQLTMTSSNGTGINVATTNAVNVNSWQMYGFNIDPTCNANMIIGNQVNKTTLLTNVFDGGKNAPFKIGGRGTEYFNGTIDEVVAFRSQPTNKQLLDWYNQSKFGGNQGFGIPVIYYHIIDDNPNYLNVIGDTIYVNTSEFARQMLYLNNSGFRTVSVAQIEQWRKGLISLPWKSVNIQFDDAWDSVYTNASPVMAQYNYTGTLGLIAGGPSGVGNISGRIMTWDMVNTLKNQGWEIASHSLTHSQLATINSSQIDRELNESRWIIFFNTSVMPTYFIYPANSRNALTDANCSKYYTVCSGLATAHFLHTQYNFTDGQGLFYRAGMSNNTIFDNIPGTMGFIQTVDNTPYLEFYYKLEENNGSILFDMSNNTAKANLTNALLWSKDGILVPLVKNTDYTLSSFTVNFVNDALDYSYVLYSYITTFTECDSSSRLGYKLIIIFSALIIPILAIGFSFKDGIQGVNTSKLIIMFISIVVSLALFSAVTGVIPSECSAIG